MTVKFIPTPIPPDVWYHSDQGIRNSALVFGSLYDTGKTFVIRFFSKSNKPRVKEDYMKIVLFLADSS